MGRLRLWPTKTGRWEGKHHGNEGEEEEVQEGERARRALASWTAGGAAVEPPGNIKKE